MSRLDVEALKGRGRDMKEAMGHFVKLSQSDRERLWEEQRQKSEWVLAGRLEDARRQGTKQGVQQGLTEGIKKGHKHGLEEGTQKGREEVALSLLKEKTDMDLISKVTGITKEKILTLKKVHLLKLQK